MKFDRRLKCFAGGFALLAAGFMGGYFFDKIENNLNKTEQVQQTSLDSASFIGVSEITPLLRDLNNNGTPESTIRYKENGDNYVLMEKNGKLFIQKYKVKDNGEYVFE